MSLETQTRTNEAEITVLLRTFTHVNTLDIIYIRKEKNTGIFIFQALQNGVKHI